MSHRSNAIWRLSGDRQSDCIQPANDAAALSYWVLASLQGTTQEISLFQCKAPVSRKDPGLNKISSAYQLNKLSSAYIECFRFSKSFINSGSSCIYFFKKAWIFTMVVARFVPETFTKVVLQCFCKSCQVPNVGKDMFCNNLKMKLQKKSACFLDNELWVGSWNKEI